jgi:glycosyltransferase involved in cell wall biosynthesis
MGVVSLVQRAQEFLDDPPAADERLGGSAGIDPDCQSASLRHAPGDDSDDLPFAPMRVGLNLVYLVPGETGGMEMYAREFIPALTNAAPHLELIAFINREASEAGLEFGSQVRTVVVPVRSRDRAQWVAGEQLHLPRLGRRERVEVMHSLASTAPATGRFARVTTIHDLIYRRFPEAHFGLRTLGMRLLVPMAARRSHRIIAVSRSTAQDIERFLGIGEEKVDVIYQGHGDLPAAPVDPESEAEVRDRWALGRRQVLLTLSAKRPVKNLVRLIRALALIAPDRRPVLIMPGYPTPYEADLRAEVAQLGLEDDVRMPGWIPEAQVEGLWRVASCFVFPSLFEGFGAPVLEAMRRGVPVACSDRSSLPEVAGDAARLFDPEQPLAIAVAIEAVLSDQALAAELVRRGHAQADRFSWRRTADQTLRSYERALASLRS